MRKLLFALVVAGFASVKQADCQEKLPVEELPPPAAQPQELPVPAAQPQQVFPDPLAPRMILMMKPPPDYPRPGRQTIWQLYAVDSMGHIQPRVVYSPYGAYYQYNGAPYFYSSTRPGQFSRFIVD